MIASARMYSWSPSLTAAWRRLLEWVSARAGVPLEVMDQSAPTSLDELWQREDLGCAFMCGYPWALYEKKPHLLAAPVPSPARYGGRPVYVTDFRSGKMLRPEEARFVPVVLSRDTGERDYQAYRRQADADAAASEANTQPVSWPTVVPCLDAVVDGRADVAAVDGYGLDLLRKHAPEVAGRVRVVETTIAAPSAPLVASPLIGATTRERLTTALLGAHEASEIRATLDDLLLSRFVPVGAADFQVFLDRERAAAAAGYPKLA